MSGYKVLYWYQCKLQKNEGHRAGTLKASHPANAVSVLRTLKEEDLLLGWGSNGGTLDLHSAGALSFQGSHLMLSWFSYHLRGTVLYLSLQIACFLNVWKGLHSIEMEGDRKEQSDIRKYISHEVLHDLKISCPLKYSLVAPRWSSCMWLTWIQTFRSNYKI